ncbi:unnamed protein product [Cylicostephanus goldi]|uniref:Uncharacterized protein n=1 Tax=Cylicostephanus goldi TaxID=71465 RepID=A0A3P6TSM4_CYLGO|nr:unnamed protein product [Cylicostephanus goldi]
MARLDLESKVKTLLTIYPDLPALSLKVQTNNGLYKSYGCALAVDVKLAAVDIVGDRELDKVLKEVEEAVDGVIAVVLIEEAVDGEVTVVLAEVTVEGVVTVLLVEEIVLGVVTVVLVEVTVEGEVTVALVEVTVLVDVLELDDSVCARAFSIRMISTLI